MPLKYKIKEKIIQSSFKTFMGRLEFKFVLFLFYSTPLYIFIYLLNAYATAIVLID